MNEKANAAEAANVNDNEEVVDARSTQVATAESTAVSTEVQVQGVQLDFPFIRIGQGMSQWRTAETKNGKPEEGAFYVGRSKDQNVKIAESGKVSEVFTNPQSQIARELILPQDRTVIETSGGKKLRLIFDGMQSNEPVISNMTLDCQAPVNILFADTKDFDGIVYGHMIIELPTDPHQAEKVITWLKNSPVKWKEER